MAINKQSQYYISATVRNNNNNDDNQKIIISAESLKAAFEVQKDLFNYKTKQIMNIRMSKQRPKRTKKRQYIEIKQIDDI
jgi:hypothetical protein